MDEEWVSITEAAARLSEAGDPVDRSTLSRYLKQHAEALPLRPAGKSNLVDLGALAAHRGENVRIRIAASAGVPRPSGGSQPPVSAGGRRFVGTQSDGAARKAQADAELREMDLAERRRHLTPTDEVDRAGRDAVALMASAFERAIDGDAATLSLKYGWDERMVRLALKQFTRRGLDVFHRDILDRLDALRRTGEAGDETMAAVAGTEGVALQ